jgi:hypothetical protein
MNIQVEVELMNCKVEFDVMLSVGSGLRLRVCHFLNGECLRQRQTESGHRSSVGRSLRLTF